MKAIINGKRYDTDRAIKIGQASHCNIGDFRYYCETLYRTPLSGAYFLAGEGGPMTRWAKSTGTDSWCGGAGIIQMTTKAALLWAEANLTTDEIEEHFGDQIEEA